ncbi:MAG: hypothetical protein K2M89_03875 [Clostridiales bacterium]|nr:hypothetical protein [Clostridiales bacterium]
MKKIKVFLALIFSLACMFSLVACGGRDGYFVDDSANGDITYYSSLGRVSASVEFQVYLPEASMYEVSYTLKLYYLDSLINTETFTSSAKSKGNEIVDISKYWSVDYYAGSNVSSYYFEVQVSNITAKTKSSGLSEYSGFAIGFGVVGGLTLVGLIVLFIILNKKGDKAQAE